MKILLFVFVLYIGILSAQIPDVQFWAYQLQNLDGIGSVDSLVNSYYDMLVLEPTRTDKECTDFDAAEMVARLHASAGTVRSSKLVIAYVDIGEAEDWRIYWQDWWVAPTESTYGNPDFMLTPDPDGWSGNYPVAFWDSRWQDIIVDNDSSILKIVIADGFDGIYMDWVEAYDDTVAISVAESLGITPDSAMIAFISHIRDVARSINPDFLVIAQNAAWLADDNPEYFDVIDAIAREDVSFGGEADVEWGNPLAGDVPQDSLDRVETVYMLNQYISAGLTVFSCDYALLTENIEQAYNFAYLNGYIPFVSQTPLDRLPNYTPPGYSVKERIIPNRHDIKIYPNPFNSVCYIDAPTGSKIEIYNIYGNLVANIDKEPYIWQPKGMTSGIYICNIYTSKYRETHLLSFIR